MESAIAGRTAYLPSLSAMQAVRSAAKEGVCFHTRNIVPLLLQSELALDVSLVHADKYELAAYQIGEACMQETGMGRVPPKY